MELRATLPCVVGLCAMGSVFMRGETRRRIHIEWGVNSVLVACGHIVNCYWNYFFFTMRLSY